MVAAAFTNKRIETSEYLVLVYRLLLVLILFSITRLLFYLFNANLFSHVSPLSFLYIMREGVRFDLIALIYINILFFILSYIPFRFSTEGWYRKVLKYWFIITNGTALAFNCIDIIYYRFILNRTTASVFNLVTRVDNKPTMVVSFLVDWWYIFLIWGILILLLYWSYSLVEPKSDSIRKDWKYVLKSFLAVILVCSLAVLVIKGDYLPGRIPVKMNDSGKYLNSPEEMALVQNTPFCIIRTLGKKSFEEKNYYPSENDLNKIYNPLIPPCDSLQMRKDNVVIIILESFSREFIGSLNRNLDKGTYKGYTPFLDSLISQSLVFPNAFANGRKSVDAIPSVCAGIPSLALPYMLSERSGNRINSIASLLGEEGYESAFFHGAPNGSLGFDAFTRIAGYKHYYGKKEYCSDADYDGIWGIWDEPFFAYFADEMNKMNEPFVTTLFSVSSHHPFKLPHQYVHKFPEENIPLQKCIRYTDYSLRAFFDRVKTMPWYKNTLFVITADHCSQPYYKEYKTPVNYFAIPLIFYKADNSLRGEDSSLAQQTDIMPSVLGYLHYPESYVAFGNNLFDKNSKRFAINYIEESYQFMRGENVFYFNDENCTGIYNWKNDPGKIKNLIGTSDYPGDTALFRAILQQYNNRMINNNLTTFQSKKLPAVLTQN